MARFFQRRQAIEKKYKWKTHRSLLGYGYTPVVMVVPPRLGLRKFSVLQKWIWCFNSIINLGENRVRHVCVRLTLAPYRVHELPMKSFKDVDTHATDQNKHESLKLTDSQTYYANIYFLVVRRRQTRASCQLLDTLKNKGMVSVTCELIFCFACATHTSVQTTASSASLTA
jgi:predicted protein tyrosine phosphatase